LLSRSGFYTLLGLTGLTAENMLTTLMAITILILMVLYFRFLFGYFIRNFERQADLHVFKAIGSSNSIISAFEKIAILSGNIRDLPSWHHFGIGQRVDFLEKCEADKSWIKKHNRKVLVSLLAYIAILIVAGSGKNLLPTELWKQGYDEKYTEFVLDQKLTREPDKALWLGIAGDLMQHKKMEKKAIAAYEKSLALEPANPKLLNNLAWLLLTSDDLSLRDPALALEMARSAARYIPAGHVLDTLATAYWANGYSEKAIETEKQAIYTDPAEGQYYREQILKFTNKSYEATMTKKTD
ncbi:MAG: peptidase M48 Ste24p, partial [Desulfocapsa sp.]|nr:peptidase M48 Ste24p [Desulfocapsa sp.]